MGEETMDLTANLDVEALLRGGLTRENRAVASVVPVLQHLLASEAHSLLSDAVLARVRGMIHDCAAQVMAAMAGHDPASRALLHTDPSALEACADALLEDEALLAFCHALASEGLLAERLQQRQSLDPVLSPLLQELIASEDPAIASLAMSVLAAQSRFVQTQRRMELPMGELPAELFHAVIARAQATVTGGAGHEGLARLQSSYDEGASRLGLLARLVGSMRRGVVAALALDHAGLALFASALAAQQDHPRAAVVLACLDGQGLRLALVLRAAGLSLPAIERQFALIAPGALLPRIIADLTPERAATLLNAAAPAQ